MKSLMYFSIIIFLVLLLFVSGCDLLTKDPGRPPALPPAGDLTISEVFTIPPDRYYAYSWIELLNPTDHPIPLSDLTFPATAYAVGSNGAFLRTEDDGSTWTSLPSDPSAPTLNSVSFSYPDTGYAVGEVDAIFNKGSIFKIKRDTLGNYNFTNLTSLNPAGPNMLNSVSAPLQNPLVYIVGDKGTILRSINRGASFPQENSTTTKNLKSLFFVDPTRVYAVGDSGTILKRSSGSWGPKTPPPSQATTNYHSVTFVADTGWITGDNGAIAFTKNGGGSWKAETTNVSETLRASFFSEEAGFSSRTGWVAGDNGVIIKTTDYGATWTGEESGTTSNLYSVKFVDPERGWAFGDGGTIVATTNGGRTWRPQQSNTSSRLLSAHYLQLTLQVFNFYELQIYAQKQHLFFDPATGVFNPDYVTKTDTGIVYVPAQGVAGTLSSQGFAVLFNDGTRFTEHSNYGPSSPQKVDMSIWPDFPGPPALDSTRGPDFVLFPLIHFNLLSSGEIRLVKWFVKVKQIPQFPGFKIIGRDVKTLDVVRWGNYFPQPRTFVGGDSSNYPNNVATGPIPEWQSLSRYANDYGGNPNTTSTAANAAQGIPGSFYLAQTPLPGWYSQKSR